MSKQAKAIFIFAHGAGAGKDSEFIKIVSCTLQQRNIDVHCFNFPYMQKMMSLGIRRPPDRMPKLVEYFKQQINLIVDDPKYSQHCIYVGGKSMGGRVASLVIVEQELSPRVSGLICLGFPFHPPKKPDNYRAAHLADISLPTLLLQGERDPFGTRQEVLEYSLSSSVKPIFLADGDHSFKPRKRSGESYQGNLLKACSEIEQFIGASKELINSD